LQVAHLLLSKVISGVGQFGNLVEHSTASGVQRTQHPNKSLTASDCPRGQTLGGGQFSVHLQPQSVRTSVSVIVFDNTKG